MKAQPRSAIRVGRGRSSPPQFGQLPSSSPSAQEAQNVHSKLQILASGESGPSAAPHRSHDVRISSIATHLVISGVVLLVAG
jgi:hypothetical protein